MMVWVAPTETFGNFTVAPISPPLGALATTTLVDVDLGAQLPEAVKEEIDRPGANGAAAGERNAGLMSAGEQRPDDPEARAHHRDKLVGRGGVDDLGGVQCHLLAVEAVAGAAAMDGDIDAVILEDLFELLDVGEARHVAERERFGGEERRDHQRQGGVFGAGNGDFAPKLVATNDADAIHELSPKCRQAPAGSVLAEFGRAVQGRVRIVTQAD